MLMRRIEQGCSSGGELANGVRGDGAQRGEGVVENEHRDGKDASEDRGPR